MAKLYPEYEKISSFRPKPTEGEWELLSCLKSIPGDSYEVYFQPWINGENPDIVVMRKGHGVIIFEVKDWNLDNYKLEYSSEDDRFEPVIWRFRSNIIRSPISQVKGYKASLYNLHIPNLSSMLLRDAGHFRIVSCAVYFHKAQKHDLDNKIAKYYKNESRSAKFSKYIRILPRESIDNGDMTNYVTQRLSKRDKYFKDEYYHSLRRYLQPTWSQLESCEPVSYSNEQLRLIPSRCKIQQKIKGAAGSGKTVVLAKRAVNALERGASKVLILTYNISLRNYIHDRLSEVGSESDPGKITLIHYHQFFSAMCKNHNLQIDSISCFDDKDFFHTVKHKITKFDAIFIDEIQDYKKEWVEIILKYFLSEDGEYVAFCDEKQNIYNRPVDSEKRIYTGVGGGWNILSTSYRLHGKLVQIANAFQAEFFDGKYELDHIKHQQLGLPFDSSMQMMKYTQRVDMNSSYLGNMFNLFESYNIHPNNVCMLSASIDNLRAIEYSIRRTINEKTAIMFETIEEFHDIYYKHTYQTQRDVFDSIYSGVKREEWIQRSIETECAHYLLDLGIPVCEPVNIHNMPATCNNLKQILSEENREMLNESLIKLRRSKKFNFWMNPGVTKLSTIHSFKGWEIHTLVLILNEKCHDDAIDDLNPNDSYSIDELIYTALTRCRYNLYIVDSTDSKYAQFFKSQVED